MGLLQSVSDTFWDNDFWLQPNVTWDDFQPNESYVYCDHRDLVYPLPFAVVLFLVRKALEKFCFAPLGMSLGLRPKNGRQYLYHSILEDVYQSKQQLNHKKIAYLASHMRWSARKVERWFRVRRNQDKPSTLDKFCENGWSCTYYTFSSFFGLFVLWEKPWLWDIMQCWVGYPLEQSLTMDVWWYYMTSTAFYYSLCISQFFDVKRKDFWALFIHHLATVSLLNLSWVCGIYRAGTLVLLVHDLSDVFIDALKVAKYARFQKVCDALTAIFVVVWFTTRIGLYPFWILYSFLVTAPAVMAMFPAFYLVDSLLIVLLILHLFWSYLICKLVRNSVLAGHMEKDVRSESSEEECDAPNDG